MGYPRPPHILFQAMQSLNILLLCWALSVPPFLSGMCLAGGMLSWTLFIIFLNVPHNAVLMSESEQSHSTHYRFNKIHNMKYKCKIELQTRSRLYFKGTLKCIFMITCLQEIFKGTDWAKCENGHSSGFEKWNTWQKIRSGLTMQMQTMWHRFMLIWCISNLHMHRFHIHCGKSTRCGELCTKWDSQA